MKARKNIFLLPFLVVLFLTLPAVPAEGYQSRYLQYQEQRFASGGGRFKERPIPVSPSQTLRPNDRHFQVLGWNPMVPVRRIVGTLQEGITDQLTVLRLFSSPNIITRSDQEKETWIYHWLWSYRNEEDPNTTLILMNKQGSRLKNNRKPVSMVVTFNDKNVVESYAIRLLKVRSDSFYGR